MIVSETHRFICFQPWKVASSTLYLRLQQYDTRKYPQEDHFNDVLNRLSHRHISLDDFYYLPESRKNYFKFCFVRNIYDRFYSGYQQRLWRAGHHPADVVDPREAKAVNGGFRSYTHYIYQMYKKDGTVIGDFLHNHIYRNDQNDMDFIGYCERFESDLEKVSGILQLDKTDKKNSNVRTTPGQECDPHNMALSDYKYLNRFDRESIDMVNEIYARDFVCLGYQVLDPKTFPP